MRRLILLAWGVFFIGMLNAQPQLANPALEFWSDTGLGYENPDGFITSNDTTIFGAVISCEKTTDANNGIYAAKLTAVTVDPGDGTGPHTFPGVMAVSDSAIVDGMPYTVRPDSVAFWYKYMPQGGDQGKATVQLSQNGNVIATGQFIITSAQSTYKRAVMAFNYVTADVPDTLNMKFVTGGDSSSTAGTMLYIDDIEIIKNDAGLNESANATIPVFPNPANESIQVDLSNDREISIYTSTGKWIETVHAAANGQNTKINTRDYAEGIYVMKSESGSVTRFTVKH